MNQVELAQRMADSSHLVNQSQVSDLMNIKAKSVSRSTVFRALTRGFGLDRDNVDALLWLFDAEPMSDKETTNAFASSNIDYSGRENILREAIMKLLRDVLNDSSIRDKAEVQIEFGSGQRARLEEARTLKKIDEQPGHRMSVTKYPPALVAPPDVFKAPDFIPDEISEDGAREEFLELQRARRGAFEKTLSSHGARSVHSRKALRRYLHDGVQHRIRTLATRRKQLDHWITLLNKYEDYCVAFVDWNFELEIGIKNTYRAILRGTPADGSPGEPPGPTVLGPSHIFWKDQYSVLHFLLHFEEKWSSIPSRDRDKTEVIKLIRRELDQTS